MITRPLDLSSRLRPAPRSFDALFYVNVGLIALFFTLFGSRFVLAPGISVLPTIAGSDANARRTTHTITVWNERQILAGDGLQDLAGLGDWLREQARTAKAPTLLVLSNHGVEVDLIAKIFSAAENAGFTVHIASVEPQKERATRER